MLILGVGYLSEASATLIKDGEILAAVSEERLNRKKLWYGIPKLAIAEVLRLGSVTIEAVDCIATYGLPKDSPHKHQYELKDQLIRQSELDEGIKETQLDALWNRFEHEVNVNQIRTPGNIKKIEELGPTVYVYDHHTAHAASAYFASGWDNCYVLTADGWGDEASSKLFQCQDGNLQPISCTNTIDSLGYFYGSITKSLGFKPHRHEGKVLGLAAYGDPQKCYGTIGNMIGYDADRKRFVGQIERGFYRPRFENPLLDEYVQNYAREDVAATTQFRLEEVVLELVESLAGENIKIALAGGIFANVKLNQKIVQAANVSEVFIFPNMGDGGLSVGAAWLCQQEKAGLKSKLLTNVYLGSEYSDLEIEQVLSQFDLDYSKPTNLPKAVADVLSQGNVVANFNGRMEFGPRALGNRSIFYRASDPDVNQWLNQKLHRSEFMPFAPVTLAEFADRYYLNVNPGRHPARFMTMTFDCTDAMKRDCPAAVHVDGTARPQLVSQADNPHLYAILSEYHQLTGIPTLINTSFNMHEEPIVCSPEDAVRAFLASELAYLAIGSYLVKGRGK